jgi:hypothetical protein
MAGGGIDEGAAGIEGPTGGGDEGGVIEGGVLRIEGESGGAGVDGEVGADDGLAFDEVFVDLGQGPISAAKLEAGGDEGDAFGGGVGDDGAGVGEVAGGAEAGAGVGDAVVGELGVGEHHVGVTGGGGGIDVGFGAGDVGGDGEVGLDVEPELWAGGHEDAGFEVFQKVAGVAAARGVPLGYTSGQTVPGVVPRHI